MRNVFLALAMAACAAQPGQVDTSSVEQLSGGTCTGTHDICRPVTCTYTTTPTGARMDCDHNRQQDQMCDALCRDRGGGRCGMPADFEVYACLHRCAGPESPAQLLCLASCYSQMPGYCEPAEVSLQDHD